MREPPKLGDTGKFPRGKLTPEDEGELRFAVSGPDAAGLIRIDFGKPVAWLAFTREDAVKIARLLLSKAGATRITIEIGGKEVADG